MMLATDLGAFCAECHKFPDFRENLLTLYLQAASCCPAAVGFVHYNTLEGQCAAICVPVRFSVLQERSFDS